MRIFYLLTAMLVAAGIYMLVIEREALFELAGATVENPADTVTEGADAAPSGDLDMNEADRRIAVVALQSTAREIDTAVLVRGRTEAAREVEVRAETSGLIINEPRRKGTLVAAGDLLCEIDPGTRDAALMEAQARLAEARARVPEARARVSEADARLNEAQINDRAARSLSESGFAAETRVAATAASVSSAQAQVESARTGLESAETGVQSAAAGVAVAQKEIERLTITAPFSGLLESDTAELGALMQPGQPCATVIQLDPIKLVGFVPEAQVERVKLGAEAGAVLVSGARVAGLVTYLSRSADPETRTFRVEVTVANPELAIRDGQTAEIGISAAGEAAHLIPASALTLDDGGHLGLRIVVNDAQAGDIAAFVPVTVLRDTTEGVFVTGLPDEARVIIVGQEFVTDGVPVVVSLRDAPLSARDAEEATQ